MDDNLCKLCGLESTKVPCVGCERNELKLRLDVAVRALVNIARFNVNDFDYVRIAEETLDILGISH